MFHRVIKLIFMFLNIVCFAQVGPGDVGNSNANRIWLRADAISQLNATSVAIWPDTSGNNNDAA